MSKQLVVLGGSFNPPTLAHKQLLEQVMNALQADLGLYVPSSDFYVGRKVQRQNSHYHLLPFLTKTALPDVREYANG